MSIKAITKGMLTYFVPSSFYSSSTGGTTSARYCYSVFLRHFVRLNQKRPVRLGNIAELGPGDSLGIGLSALIAGADRYFAFDVRPFSREEQNLRVFDELVELFIKRTPIPTESEFPEIKPEISNESFPAHLLTDEHLKRTLNPERLTTLRNALKGNQPKSTSPISYVAPWFDTSLIKEGTIDWIFSQAVMEHVDDLDLVYSACNKWLRPGGVMSHQVDFRSHGTASSWDGHRAYSDTVWRLIRGARPYLINRQSLDAHRRIVNNIGFQFVDEAIIQTTPTLQRRELASRFKSLSNDDLRASGAFLASQKQTAAS